MKKFLKWRELPHNDPVFRAIVAYHAAALAQLCSPLPCAPIASEMQPKQKA